MRELFELFAVFAKIGVTTFGGGYAMLPILQREIVEERKWADEEELADYFAVAQCTPGIIAVNTATFIGFKRAGVLGGISATLGMVFPSLLIISVIAMFLQNFAEIKAVQDAFKGIRVAVCVLILNSVRKLFKKSVIDVPAAIVFALVLAVSIFTDVSPAVFVLAAAIFGITVKSLKLKKEAGK